MEEKKMNIAVFASHGGSDLQAIIDGCKSNKIGANVSVVISNNGSSMSLQRAHNEGIPSYHLSAKKFGSEDVLATEILNVLEDNTVKNNMINSIYLTLTELTEVESIRFLIEGEENANLAEEYKVNL